MTGNPEAEVKAAREAKDVRILVVDDQRTMRMLICSTLAALQCKKVAECCDGVEALAHLADHPVDLIISDVNMPRLDGFGLLRAVRSQPETEKTPFIMLTSRGDLALVKDAVTLGVNNYIIKPFNMATIKTKLEAVLGPLA
jgi:two-component system, chemotaxis family, chemotaxis protein CheY